MSPARPDSVKIAFLVGQFPALSETFILDQIVALMERGHAVSIFAERRSLDTEVHHDVLRFDLMRRTRYELMPQTYARRLIALPRVWRWRPPYVRALNVAQFGRHAGSLRLAWSVSLFDDRRDFDIVHCHFGALGLKAVMLREVDALRGRIVVTFHGEDITNYPRQFRGNIYAPLFAHGDLFLPVSARWNDALITLGCPPDRIKVHRMGVDVRRSARRPTHQSSNGRLRIVSVARLVEKKGIADAIRAVAAVPFVHEYVIVGDGPLRAELRELVRTLGISSNVRFTGALPRSEVAAALHGADVFLAPSVTATDGDIEGIPVSIMEAMAEGLPVVATRHSGIPELVADEVSGFLVDEHDVAGLAKRLSLLAADSDMRARMGLAGHAIVARQFDVRRLTEDLESHYRELLR